MYVWRDYDKLVNRITSKDKLFGGGYTLDPYQKCDFSCVYCDSSENIVYIKRNAVDLLLEEMDSLDKESKIIVGSTVDPYQAIEKKLGITRKIIKILLDHSFSVHILTKSDLIERDIDILRDGDVTVTISISTLDSHASSILEPNAPPPGKRISVIERLSDEGIRVGGAIFPIIPYLTDKNLEDIIRSFKSAGAEYIIYQYLELKGDIRDKFFGIMGRNFPDISKRLEDLYVESYTPKDYRIDDLIRSLCKKYGIRQGYE